MKNLAKIICESYPITDLLGVKDQDQENLKQLWERVNFGDPWIGDTLFQFIVREIYAIDEDQRLGVAEVAETAIKRMIRARADIQNVIDGIKKELEGIDNAEPNTPDKSEGNPAIHSTKDLSSAPWMEGNPRES